MARPSVAAQRREEILDAFELCILETGIQAVSLENIAEKAQVKRTILRHYIGNRDDIIIALSDRWVGHYTKQWEDSLNWLPQENRVDALVDSLFTVRTQEELDAITIGEAIFSEAKRLEAVKAHQLSAMKEFIDHFTRELKQQFPDAQEDKIDLVAYTVYSNYLMSESLYPLKLFDEIYKIKNATKLACSILA